MNEIWKDVDGYEGLYQISNLGNVKSFRGSTKFGKPKELILKPSTINSGYHVVTLYSENGKKRKFQIHRLVAEAFIENPEGFPCVNHKDENKTNNCVDNLEWCTYQYNNNYGTARVRASDTIARPIVQKTLNGEPLARYKSCKIAAELLGYKITNVVMWCRKGIGGGYLWEYTNEKI